MAVVVPVVVIVMMPVIVVMISGIAVIVAMRTTPLARLSTAHAAGFPMAKVSKARPLSPPPAPC